RAMKILGTLVERSEDDVVLKIYSLSELGNLLFKLNRIDEARHRLEEGLALAQTSRLDETNLPLLYSSVAEVYAWQDDLEAATVSYKKSAELAGRVQNYTVEADAWIALSQVQQARGRWPEAWEASIKSLHLVRTVLAQDRAYQQRVVRRMMELPSG